ncbi:MAG: hypothetical protein Q7S98_06430, partial [Deltaproteobacteria bacterium]|nr:hypothetical protein [Deltaproteobacteria bacterium]
MPSFELPYADPCSIFPLFKDQPFSLFLDSCGLGRYSFILFEPKELIRGNPFPHLKKSLTKELPKEVNLPFVGGWAGYLGYEIETSLLGYYENG